MPAKIQLNGWLVSGMLQPLDGLLIPGVVNVDALCTKDKPVIFAATKKTGGNL